MEQQINDADLAALADDARELTQSDIIGLPLEFIKGHWFIILSKDEQQEILANQEFVVDPRSRSSGWYFWQDKRLVFKIMGRRVDGFKSPARGALPLNDKKLWPGYSIGKPRDPFEQRDTLLLKDTASGELFTWITRTHGGRHHGIGKFLEEYTKQAKQYPGEDPVVISTSYDRDTDYGPTPTPLLKIVGWQPFGENRTPTGDKTIGKALREALREMLEPYLAPPKPPAAPVALAAPEKAQKGGDLNDEIPF
jgi:hypothetical protein